jgi:DNA polymerase-3 subunit delta
MLITLAGPDLYDSHVRLRSLIDRLEVRRLSAPDGVSAMAAMIGQADLFGQSVTVVLEDIFSLAVADQRRLAEHLPIALQSDQKVIVMVEADLPKGPLAEVLRRGEVEHFPLPTTAGLIKWVQQEADTLQLTVEKSAVPAFVLKFGGNKFSLATELWRLRWSQPAALNTMTVAEMLPMGVETDVFGLTDAWSQRKLENTLSQLQQLWSQQTAPQYVLAMFERQARLLYICQLLSGGAAQSDSLRTAVGLPQFVITKLAAAARKWSSPDLRGAMVGLYQLDAAIKKGQIEPRLGLERWIVTSLL